METTSKNRMMTRISNEYDRTISGEPKAAKQSSTGSEPVDDPIVVFD